MLKVAGEHLVLKSDAMETRFYCLVRRAVKPGMRAREYEARRAEVRRDRVEERSAGTRDELVGAKS